MKKITPTKNDSKRRIGANRATDEAASKQTRRRRSRASKAVGNRGEMLNQERTDVSYRKKKKDPSKKASKAGSHAATPIGKSPQLVQPPTPSPKADKNEKVDTTNTVTTDEAITGGTTSLSTVSTVSTTPSSDLPPQTPPKITGSTRKTRVMVASNFPPDEKWGGETAAKAWMEKSEFSKVKADFENINSMTVNVDKDCKKWKANSKWNQSEDYPALDSNLVKVEDGYVNMSQIDFPSTRSVLMGQIPKKDSEEAFWKVVFEKRCLLIHFIVGSNDSFDFFPQKADDYRDYGSMWVNNRKVEHLNEDICRFLIEVLSSGCSNSIVSTVTVIKNWQMDTVHPKHSRVVKETNELTEYMAGATAEDTTLVLSRHGAGRAGFFLSLWVAVNILNAKNEPCIADIVKTIRSQRPKAVGTLTRNASLYITLFYFIKRKIVKVDAGSGCQKMMKDPVVEKSVELSQNFASALLADQSVIGTTTMLTLAPSAAPPTTPSAIQGSSAVPGSAVMTVSGEKLYISYFSISFNKACVREL
ncbi:unnamed protein product [Caenorhabditis nigoni]